MARVQGETTHTVYVVVKNSVYDDNSGNFKLHATPMLPFPALLPLPVHPNIILLPILTCP